MPKQDLGTKRECPETGKKFYDLNKDPIVSPYTGKEYPLSFFEEVVSKVEKPPRGSAKPEDPEDDDEDEDDDIEDKAEKGDDDDDEEEDDTPEIDEVDQDAPIPTGDDDEDDDTSGVPEGFSEDTLDDDDDDVLLDDEDDFDIDDDTDVDLDEDIIGGDDDEDEK